MNQANLLRDKSQHYNFLSEVKKSIKHSDKNARYKSVHLTALVRERYAFSWTIANDVVD